MLSLSRHASLDVRWLRSYRIQSDRANRAPEKDKRALGCMRTNVFAWPSCMYRTGHMTRSVELCVSPQSQVVNAPDGHPFQLERAANTAILKSDSHPALHALVRWAHRAAIVAALLVSAALSSWPARSVHCTRTIATTATAATFYRSDSAIGMPFSSIAYSMQQEKLQAAFQRMEESARIKAGQTLQNFAAAPISIKITLLFLAAIPQILILGYIYKVVSGGNSLYQSVYKMYGLLYKVPGVGLGAEPNKLSALVGNLAFFVGLFVFAILLGFVNDEIKRQVKNVTLGSYPVRESNHVLVLNWNDQTVPLLRQIAFSQQNGVSDFWKDRAVVVLADKSKEQMDDTIAEGLRGTKLDYQTRSGRPSKVDDLNKVSASTASTVLLLRDGKSAPSLQVAAAMGLVAAGCDQDQQVIVQAPWGSRPDDSLASFREASDLTGRSFSMFQLPDSVILNRILTLTSLQPGLLRLWQALLHVGRHAGGPGFHFLKLPEELEGSTYGEARRSSTSAVVCGVMAPDGSVTLNPPDKHALKHGEQLVAVSDQRAHAPLQGDVAGCYMGAMDSAGKRRHAKNNYRTPPQHVLVVNPGEPGVREALNGIEFAPPGSTFTFIMEEVPARLPSSKGDVKVQFVQSAHPTAVRTLLNNGIDKADTVVLAQGGAGINLDQNEQDAAILSGILHLQHAVMDSGRARAPHVVAIVRHNRAAVLLQSYLASVARDANARAAEAGTPVPPLITNPEIMHFSDMLSALLARLAEEPRYTNIMAELLYSSKGSEIYLRRPMYFNLAYGSQVTFAEVAETVRQFGQTALGFLTADGKVRLAPRADVDVTLQPGDQIVVIADDY